MDLQNSSPLTHTFKRPRHSLESWSEAFPPTPLPCLDFSPSLTYSTSLLVNSCKCTVQLTEHTGRELLSSLDLTYSILVNSCKCTVQLTEQESSPLVLAYKKQYIEKLTEINIFRVKKNEGIFHIFDQIKVSRIPL